MNRRKFLKGTFATTATIGLIGTGVWMSIDENTEPLTIDAAILVIHSLSDQNVSHLGEWNPTQIINHCAQSVEFSMSGFPMH